MSTLIASVAFEGLIACMYNFFIDLEDVCEGGDEVIGGVGFGCLGAGDRPDDLLPSAFLVILIMSLFPPI